MKAAIFKAQGVVVCEEVEKPTIEHSTDAIVRVVRACVCGSDLWWYRDGGKEPGQVGHEGIGVIETVGDDVKDFKPGDFVVIPFRLGDGTCVNCRKENRANCAHASGYGTGQAQFARVEWADGSLYKIPAGSYSDEQLASLLTLSDVMGTGYHAAISAEVKAGDTVAVIGDGAVGLCAVIAAKMLGAEKIILMSRHEDRQALGREFGATDIVAERGEKGIAQTNALTTEQQGVDAVLECVGTNDALQTAFAIAAPGAMIGTVGLPHDVEVPFLDIFFRNVGIHGGPAPTRTYAPLLLDAVLKGDINPGKVFTLSTDLDHIAEAYAAMDERRAIKSLLKVSELEG